MLSHLSSAFVVRFCAAAILIFAPAFAAISQEGTKAPDMDREEYGDWIVECFSGSTKAEDCQLSQRVTTGDGSFVAMIVTFAWSPEKKTFETEVALPLGVLLSAPPLLQIGPDYSAQLAWSRCTSDGCLVEGAPSPKIFDLLQTSERASISVMHPTDGQVTIPVSLSGFKEALQKVTPK